MNLEQGRKLIKLARDAIFSKNTEVKEFEQKQGVFVTLLSYPSKSLRGCIGFPQPVKLLKEAVVEAAKAAAFEDSRFTPVSKEEKFIIEISVLTIPEEIKYENEEQLLKQIRIGKDGLIIERGLLLPQVFPEWKADAKKALEMTCEKSGIEWKKGLKVYRFQAEIFAEEEPEGKVIKKEH